MVDPQVNQGELYALLIGIDCYLPNQLPGDAYYPTLQGCINDISMMESFLKTRLQLAADHILKLTSTGSGLHPQEKPADLPTYQNMVNAFCQITAMAPPGSQVLIHYSGHGGRTPSLRPELKSNGLDEALVPVDIGTSTSRYLRDIEIAFLLQQMVAKGLWVTLVLDSCHSGGAVRGASDIAVRGLDVVDNTPRPLESAVASIDTLADTWVRLGGEGRRDLQTASGWLPDSNEFVLLAACRPSEAAYETFTNGEKHGILSYWLLEALRQAAPGLTYRQLHSRLLARVHSQFNLQTPMLIGLSDRTVFGSDRVKPQYAVTVMQIDISSRRLCLNTGQVQGIKAGAEFAIYPLQAADFTNESQRLGKAVISEAGDTQSWACLAESAVLAAIKPGDQAVLVHPGNVQLQRAVALVGRGESGLLPLADQQRALKKVHTALRASRTGFVLVRDQGKIDFQLAINASGEYEIWDPDGKPFPNLRPPVAMNQPGAARIIASRLIHLAKYRNVQALLNTNSLSTLAHKLEVSLLGVQDDFEPGDQRRPKPFPGNSCTPVIAPGQWTFLKIKNNSGQVLNITALDLSPDWSVRQIFPASDVADNFYPFDPGQEEIIDIRTYLPPGYTEATDIIKVFATLGDTNFRWLELSGLDQPHSKKSISKARAEADPLEALLASMTTGRPTVRHLEIFPSTNLPWTVEQVEIHVKR